MFVRIEDVTFRYSKKQVPTIENFSLEIRKGEIVGILGASGSGKSTFLRIIGGLEDPERGNIQIDGQTIVSENINLEAEKRGVGMVFQDYALFPYLTVAENVSFGLHKLNRKERQERLDEMLDLVQLTEYKKRYPHELSGGQQQRIALARALAPRPSILLMDEPFSNLDTDLKESIRTELRQILQLAEMTCLFVSHDQADVDAICDRVIQMGITAAEEKDLESELALV